MKKLKTYKSFLNEEFKFDKKEDSYKELENMDEVPTSEEDSELESSKDIKGKVNRIPGWKTY